jgi:hypothetical protein
MEGGVDVRNGPGGVDGGNGLGVERGVDGGNGLGGGKGVDL